MNIYFAGSIRGGRDDAALYLKLIEHLKRYGTVLSEHIGKQSVSQMGSKGTVEDIYKQDMQWLLQSDVIVAEVTQASLGVGFELAQALQAGKNILCLYRPSEGKSLSAMIAGCPGLKTVEYTSLEGGQQAIDTFMKELPEKTDVIVDNAYNLGKDSGQWISGHFKDKLHSNQVEVKWCLLEPGYHKPLKVNAIAKTIVILIRGKSYILMGDRDDILLQKEGDMVYLGEGVVNGTKTVEESLFIVIRWPSIPNDQKSV